jgi:hypothetical protein
LALEALDEPPQPQARPQQELRHDDTFEPGGVESCCRE